MVIKKSKALEENGIKTISSKCNCGACNCNCGSGSSCSNGGSNCKSVFNDLNIKFLLKKVYSNN